MKRYIKYAIFVIWWYVYLTLTFDPDKGHNFILSVDLKRVYAVAYFDEKKMKLAFWTNFMVKKCVNEKLVVPFYIDTIY